MKKLSVLVLVLFVGSAIYAQSEEVKPQKYDDVTWHSITVVDYKPGKVEEAKKIIEKFESAAASAGTPTPVQYWFETGKYDMVIIWELQGGPVDLEWSQSPNGVKWWKAFVAQEGSEEAAQKVQDDYNSLVASSNSNIARKQK
ncbi:MAG: hypothetical protein ABFS38_04895 [Bacteroidota bacterium]